MKITALLPLIGAASACLRRRAADGTVAANTFNYTTTGGPLNWYSANDIKFENLGSGPGVVLTNGSLAVGNITYPLSQFHFHNPSEHRVNDEDFPMEADFVFETSATVIASLFQLSEFGYSAFLFDSVFAHIDDIAEAGTYTTTSPLGFNCLGQRVLGCID